MIDMGKVIRNTNISANAKLTVARGLAKYFLTIDPLAETKVFMQIASGVIESDPMTETYTHYKEDENEKV